jgi:hypothetical protein
MKVFLVNDFDAAPLRRYVKYETRNDHYVFLFFTIKYYSSNQPAKSTDNDRRRRRHNPSTQVRGAIVLLREHARQHLRRHIVAQIVDV